MRNKSELDIANGIPVASSDADHPATGDMGLSRIDRNDFSVSNLTLGADRGSVTGVEFDSGQIAVEGTVVAESSALSRGNDSDQDQTVRMFFGANGRPERYFSNHNGNNFPPTVFVDDRTIQLVQFIPIHTAFTVSDIDPNSTVTRYRFRDSNTTAQSGFFSLSNVANPQGQVLEIDASLLFEVKYHAGAQISSESITIEAFDGKHWSLPGEGIMFSVQPNLSRPIVTVSNFDVLSTETVNMADVVSATDPDGYPILEYMFVDRLANVNGGHFVFKGVRMPSATFFRVQADELQFLKYQGGQFGQAERIGVFARDAGAWSLLAEATATTTPNIFRPRVTAVATTVLDGQSVNGSQLFDATDQDGNSIKRVSFLDTGASATSGYFTVGGIQQAANVWFSVDIKDLGTVKYIAGSTLGSENFRVQVWDGRYKSNVSSAVIETVVKPDVTTDTIFMLDELERVPIGNLINVSTGPSVLRYEVIDLNDAPTSATLRMGTQFFDAHQVHTFTINEFTNLMIQGGKSDLGRSFDEILVRADNGFAKSGWTGINISTDPVNQAAVLQIGKWSFTTDPLELSFNFPTQINPFYCLNGFDECQNHSPMDDPDMRQAVRGGFESIANMINVRFEEVANTGRADIEFYLTTLDGPGNILAYAYAPGVDEVFDFRGDIFGDGTDPLIFDSEPGGIGFATWIHEIGHALGLDHSFSGNDVLPIAMENNRFSIMSYDRVFGDLEPVTMQLYDIMGLQTLYGPNMNYNTGNDQIRVKPANSPIQRTIWDAAGVDTLNFQNHNTDNVIDLRQGQFSSLGGRTDNFAIAWGVDIENGRGGTGNDTLIGNELSNQLFGNGGRDRMIGNGGDDVLRGLAGSDTYVWTIGDGWDLIIENREAGRDVLEIHGFGSFDSLHDDFAFRKLGRNLRIDLTLDRERAFGGVTIRDQAWGGSRVETLRLFDVEGEQMGPDISLLSVFANATNNAQQFRVTANTSIYGNLAVPV